MDFYLNPFQRNKHYFANPLAEYVYFAKYSRWRDDLGRREVWNETVQRSVDYLRELSGDALPDKDYRRIHSAMLRMDILPSMRLVAMAGKAARARPISIYNCSALPLDTLDAFPEIMYLSMNGVGVGFSVESRFVEQLPVVSRQRVATRGHQWYTVDDSTEGWCNAFRAGLNAWFNGYDFHFDYSRIRPAGSILKTKGGTASGKQPLVELMQFARNKILSRQGGRLSTLDIYDIATKIADCVVMGGSRRSAMIALFDHDDDAMLNAKNGPYWEFAPWRANANNSAVFNRKMDRDEIDNFVDLMHDGFNGEPGFFSRYAVNNTLPLRRNKQDTFLTNPCCETLLRSGPNGGGLCNLSSVTARSGDTFNDLADRVELASIIGTIQSLATDFHYLRDGWKHNAEEERLLGVDITGHYDCPTVRNPLNQIALKSVAVQTNKQYAHIFDIPQSVAVTAIKPSGNSGVLRNASSGVHPRWSQHYQRNVRVNINSPLLEVLRANNVPLVRESDTTYVVGFAVASPEGAITRHDLSARDHLAYWKQTKMRYTEHSVSMTCYYDPDDLDFIKRWIYDNQHIATGVSFLPRSDAKYDNAPYVELTEHEYHCLKASERPIDYSVLTDIERTDQTESAQELACVAGQCDLHI